MESEHLYHNFHMYHDFYCAAADIINYQIWLVCKVFHLKTEKDAY